LRVKVRAFASFREILGGETEVEIPEGATMHFLLQSLSMKDRRFEEEAFAPSGEPRDHLYLMINRKRINPAGGLQISLCEGDEVAIFPPVAGG
jgi:molybdopterin synthase sulfur carrier subunit